MKKYKCPAPSSKCSNNKKGICCEDCKRYDKCPFVCMNKVMKCGAKLID